MMQFLRRKTVKKSYSCTEDLEMEEKGTISVKAKATRFLHRDDHLSSVRFAKILKKRSEETSTVNPFESLNILLQGKREMEEYSDGQEKESDSKAQESIKQKQKSGQQNMTWNDVFQDNYSSKKLPEEHQQQDIVVYKDDSFHEKDNDNTEKMCESLTNAKDGCDGKSEQSKGDSKCVKSSDCTKRNESTSGRPTICSQKSSGSSSGNGDEDEDESDEDRRRRRKMERFDDLMTIDFEEENNPEAPAKDQEVPAKDQDVQAKDQEVSAKDQKAPAMDQEAPSKDQKAPANDQEELAKSQETLAKGQETPAKDQEAPAKDQEALTKDQEAPAKDQVAPAKDQEAPAKDQEAPAKDQEAPAKDQEAPAKDQAALTKDQEAPTKDQEVPTKDQEVPAKDQEAPAKDQEAPSKDQKAPANDQEVPAKDQDVQAKDQEVPAKDQKAPAMDQETPSKDQKAPANDQEELAKSQETLAKGQETLAKDQEAPAKDQEAPGKTWKQPAKDQKASVNDREALANQELLANNIEKGSYDLVAAFRCHGEKSGSINSCKGNICYRSHIILDHSRKCRFRVLGGCKKCKELSDIYLHHTSHCKFDKCVVTQCCVIKQYLKENNGKCPEKWSYSVDCIFFGDYRPEDRFTDNKSWDIPQDNTSQDPVTKEEIEELLHSLQSPQNSLYSNQNRYSLPDNYSLPNYFRSRQPGTGQKVYHPRRPPDYREQSVTYGSQDKAPASGTLFSVPANEEDDETETSSRSFTGIHARGVSIRIESEVAEIFAKEALSGSASDKDETSLPRPENVKVLHALNENKLNVKDGRYDENHEWRIVHKNNFLGRGAFGVVRLCINMSSMDHFAAKIIQKNKFDHNELDIWASVSGQSLRCLELLGAVCVDESVIMFMEYMEGGSVENMLSYLQENRFDEYSACYILREVLEGLDFLHCRRIIHRDIKGGNILVNSTLTKVKLADYGAAVRLGDQEFSKQENRPPGTENFMAPEVCRSEEHSFSSDIWSTGCSLYQMLEGQPPWIDYNAVIYKVGTTKEPPVFPQCSEATTDLLYQMFKLKAQDRPTAKELLRHNAFNKVDGPPEVPSLENDEDEQHEPEQQQEQQEQNEDGNKDDESSSEDEFFSFEDDEAEEEEEDKEEEEEEVFLGEDNEQPAKHDLSLGLLDQTEPSSYKSSGVVVGGADVHLKSLNQLPSPLNNDKRTVIGESELGGPGPSDDVIETPALIMSRPALGATVLGGRHEHPVSSGHPPPSSSGGSKEHSLNSSGTFPPVDDELLQLQSDFLRMVSIDGRDVSDFVGMFRITSDEEQDDVFDDAVFRAYAEESQESEAIHSPGTTYSMRDLTRVDLYDENGSLLFTVREKASCTFGNLAENLYTKIREKSQALKCFTFTFKEPNTASVDPNQELGSQDQVVLVLPATDMDEWENWRIDSKGIVELS